MFLKYKIVHVSRILVYKIDIILSRIQQRMRIKALGMLWFILFVVVGLYTRGLTRRVPRSNYSKKKKRKKSQYWNNWTVLDECEHANLTLRWSRDSKYFLIVINVTQYCRIRKYNKAPTVGLQLGSEAIRLN